MSSRANPQRASHGPELGLTLLEVVISMMILMVGLLAVAGAVVYSVNASNMSRNVTDAKQIIVSTLEQMENLRNTGVLTFAQIANTGAVDNTGAAHNFAGFPTGFQPVSIQPGPDGIFGTADDLVDPGPDGVYGTGDDFTNNALARTGYTRQIVISSLSDNLKKIQVTLHYPGANGTTLTLVGTSYLNYDSRGTYQR
jgi:type II secretory pathway pseudopilin PulG